jgi:radical SAM superfamily enzyme YgiQ (UPF0313 family)
MPVQFLLLTNVASPVWQRSIGAYQIAHHCRKNLISCQVVDFINLFRAAELEKILSSFIDHSTVAIGISSTFFNNLETKKNFVTTSRHSGDIIPLDIKLVLQTLKQKYPKLKIIGGGANSHQLENDTIFDVVFHGYSEETVVNYLKCLITKSGYRLWPKKGNIEIVDDKNLGFDITQLDHQWHTNDCILQGETLPIEISRGCIFKCSFCSYPLNGKKKLDYLRDPAWIKDELYRNYEEFGTVNYYFTDDTFNDSTEKLQQLHKEITSLPFKINFVTYLRLDLLYAHKHQLNLLKEMGLGSAFFGIETLNHQSGKLVGKGMKPEVVKDFLYEIYYNHWNQQIPITCSFIIGLPEETIDSVMQTYAWSKNAPINDLWFPLTINTDGYYLSDFDKQYKKYGYEIDTSGEWSNQHMTQSQALALAEEFNATGSYYESAPSSWLLFSLLSHGYSIAELKDKKLKDMHWESILLKKYKLFQQYKQKLLALC